MPASGVRGDLLRVVLERIRHTDIEQRRQAHVTQQFVERLRAAVASTEWVARAGVARDDADVCTLKKLILSD